MTEEATTFKPENEKTYEALISLIENSQGRLAPIVVGCDDENLRSRVIDRYEAEAKVAKIQPYRIKLGSEPSIRAGLARLKESEAYIQNGGEAVFTVTGAEFLLWIKLDEDEQSDLDKFFGYLQWTREGLREYPYPIVIWVPHRILRQMSQRAPDFWSWRKAVLRFVDESATPIVQVNLGDSTHISANAEDVFLPPPEEIIEEIQQLERTSIASASLATLYDKLGQIYSWRVQHGEADNFVEEQQAAIEAFEQAINIRKLHQDSTELVGALTRLGDFLHSQSRFLEAVRIYEKSLEISQDKQQEARLLGNLGKAYEAIGETERANESYQQSLKIKRETGDIELELSKQEFDRKFLETTKSDSTVKRITWLLSRYDLKEYEALNEIIYEVYIRGIKTLERGNELKDFEKWVRVTAHNIVRERFRQKQRATKLESKLKKEEELDWEQLISSSRKKFNLED
jgi:tetratricopeptide (TPR) repeat protein